MANDGNLTCTKNISDPSSYWHQYCTWIERNETRKTVHTPRGSAKISGVNYNFNPLKPKSKGEWSCDPYFETYPLRLERAVPGIASGVIHQNLPPRFNYKGNLVTMDDDSTYSPELPKYRNVLVDITTTFVSFHSKPDIAKPFACIALSFKTS